MNRPGKKSTARQQPGLIINLFLFKNAFSISLLLIYFERGGNESGFEGFLKEIRFKTLGEKLRQMRERGGVIKKEFKERTLKGKKNKKVGNKEEKRKLKKRKRGKIKRRREK